MSVIVIVIVISFLPLREGWGTSEGVLVLPKASITWVSLWYCVEQTSVAARCIIYRNIIGDSCPCDTGL